MDCIFFGCGEVVSLLHTDVMTSYALAVSAMINESRFISRPPDESTRRDGEEILRARLWANRPSAARVVVKKEKQEAMIKARILASIASAAEAKATRAEAAKAEAAKAKAAADKASAEAKAAAAKAEAKAVAAAAKAAWRENRNEEIKAETIQYARRATRLANLIEHMKTIMGFKKHSDREDYMREFWIEKKIDLTPDDGLFGHVMVKRVSDWLSLPQE